MAETGLKSTDKGTSSIKNVLVSFSFVIQGIVPIEADTDEEALNIARDQFKDKKDLTVEIYHEPIPEASEDTSVPGAGDVRHTDGGVDSVDGDVGEGSPEGSSDDVSPSA